MKKNRWIAFLCVCGLLCGVLCACGDARPTESKPSSASTTTSSATTTTTTSATTTAPTVTTTATTTRTTTSRQVHTTSRTTPRQTDYKQFYFNYLGERVLMTYEQKISLPSSYPIKKVDGNWIIVNNDKSFCVAEDIEDKELDLWRYKGQLANGNNFYCDVHSKTKKIYTLHDGAGSRMYGENDKAVVHALVKNRLNAMGYHYSDGDIQVTMNGDKSRSLGYFAYVFVYNENDGGLWAKVQKYHTTGWRISRMYLSVDNVLANPEWIA